MTHNIIAQFACSVYTSKDTRTGRIPSNKVQGDFKDYQVVSGSVFDEEFNETLDSATLVLSQIPKEDRLSKIKSYQFVRVFDKSTFNPLTGKYGFDQIYLVDNFNEEEDNINEHIFSYTVNLMSLTKFLEKIQCPNLTITHEIENGELVKKTIYQKMAEYFDLYVPKMKFSSDGVHWEYRPLIEIRSGDPHSNSVSFDRIEPRDFVAVGNEWEVTSYAYLSLIPGLDVDKDDINQDSIVIKNVEISGDVTFNSSSVTFDKANERFVFYGIVSQLPEEDVEVSFGIDYFDSFFEQRFRAKCADMSFNCPTLRQLITTLMQQVGCIPTVKNRILSYLDFQKDAVKFGGEKGYKINNTVNKIKRSLSSDSFVNTLLNISQNVLDSGNEVLCETLGFRDRENVLLKQQENLFLETKFPIYKVNYFRINAYVKSNTNVKGIQDYMSVGVPGESTKTIQWRLAFSKPDADHVRLDFGMSIDAPGVVDIRGDIVAFKYNYTTPQIIRDVQIHLVGSDYQIGVDDVYEAVLDDATFDMFYFNGFITIYDEAHIYSNYRYAVFYPSFESRNNLFSNLLTLYSQDITNLLVENSIRQNLLTDFKEMCTRTSSASTTLEDIAEYIYGTIGYDIGSNRIGGFSQTFVKGDVSPTGWIEAGYTYIENIWNFITTHYQDDIRAKIYHDFADMPVVHDDIWQDGVLIHPGDDTNVEINSISGYNPWETTDYDFIKNLLFISDLNFVAMWFDIKYQPLNSFNMAYVKSKEQVDFLLQQYDGNSSGLTDFDRLSIHEQEQVDRVGNETITINQRTTDFSDIQDFSNGPLCFRDDTNRDGSVDEDADIDDGYEENDNGVDYIVFKRSFTINNNCFDAHYVGSKDAVLKDYFTSIRTKYRAYNYVDYSQSVVRKERDTFFVKISENGWYNGDDKIFFGELEQANASLAEQRRKISWLIPSNSYRNEDKYIFSESYNTVEKDSVVAAKNDISKVSHNNFIGFIYEEYDNVSAGSYIPEYAHTQTLWSFVFNHGQDEDGSIIGGVPQEWQIWRRDFYDSHQVGFYSKLNLNEIFNTFVGDIDQQTKEEIEQDLQKVFQMPIVDESLLENKAVFHVMDDNTDIENPKRTFYKDLSERINHTVQFIYYTDSKNIIWNEDFLAGKFAALPNATSAFFALERRIVDLTGKEFVLNKEEYFTDEAPLYVSMASAEYVAASDTNPYIYIRWDLIPEGITQFKIVEVRTLGAGRHYCKDIIAFRKNDSEEQKFYITLNDTKSDYVMAERDGILYRRYKVRQNTSDRLVDKIHDL